MTCHATCKERNAEMQRVMRILSQLAMRRNGGWGRGGKKDKVTPTTSPSFPYDFDLDTAEISISRRFVIDKRKNEQREKRRYITTNYNAISTIVKQ